VLPERLDGVLKVLYLVYNEGYSATSGDALVRRELSAEAIRLTRVVVSLLPDEPEALGLLALMLYCEARRAARRTAAGEYVPISAQDPELWDSAKLTEAEQLLTRAASLRRPGRFQLEAAVQSAHVERRRGGDVDWLAIATLYEGVIRVAPTFGALLGRAASVARARGPAAGLALLDAIPLSAVEAHQPYWAARGHLLLELGRFGEAALAFDEAIRLTEDAAVRRFLSAAAARIR
jgi:RNA polymerase sigma-70 factor (ECF subfamily)